MSKRYHRRQYKKPDRKELRKNWNIRVPEVLVIDDEGQSLGVLAIGKAMALAQEREFDLVEVSPKAQPPVCRIMDYGQHLYRVEKAERKHKAKQKKIDVKGIRLTLKMSQHDLEIRKVQALKFIEKGHRLKIEMNLKGRERQRMDLAAKIVDDFIASLGPQIVVEQPLSRQGGRLTLVALSKQTQASIANSPEQEQ